MLKLTRQPNEGIIFEIPNELTGISERIIIKFEEIDRKLGYTRIGIEAPKRIKIRTCSISFMKELFLDFWNGNNKVDL
jgi:sRNA-binding carbon storage regulator CsrA